MEITTGFWYIWSMDYKKQGHCVYYSRYHLVLATKYRRKILKGGFGEYLKHMIVGLGRQIPEIEIVEVNTDVDHVHVLLSIPPKLSVSEVVKMLKAKTGLRMRQRFPFLDKVYWGQEGIWSRGYFVSTVGISESTIRKYIELQGQEDSGQAKLEF